MKKHIMKTAALCAAAVVAVASSGMTAEARGPLYTEGDGWFSGDGQDEVAESYATGASGETISFTWDVGDSAPADSGASVSEPNTPYDNVSYDSGNSGSNDVSYDSGSNEASSDNSGSSSDSGSYTDNAGTNSSASASTASGVTRSSGTISINGGESFRQKSSSANGTYTVIHMGQEKYTLQLKDAAGNNVGFQGVGMYKADDGRYFINVVPNAGADTTGWSVVTMKGDKTYLPKLGISGVALDGTVIVDVDAEAAAQ